jgi:hypothetical protein
MRDMIHVLLECPMEDRPWGHVARIHSPCSFRWTLATIKGVTSSSA